MLIHPLSEGVFTIGHDKIFLPFDPEQDVLEERSRGSLLVEVQPFLIERGNDLLLCDTGLGFSNASGNLQIHENLARLGYSAHDVTQVLVSHLHKDHAGGLLYRNSSGHVQAAFPDARHYIRRSEWDAALATGAPSYQTGDFAELEALANVEWLEGTSGEPAPGIFWEHSGGHSPQHVVFRITKGSETAFFGGDEAPQLKQMKMRYVARYDYDGERALQLRQDYGRRGGEAGWQFLFYHDIKTPVARLG